MYEDIANLKKTKSSISKTRIKNLGKVPVELVLRYYCSCFDYNEPCFWYEIDKKYHNRIVAGTDKPKELEQAFKHIEKFKKQVADYKQKFKEIKEKYKLSNNRLLELMARCDLKAKKIEEYEYGYGAEDCDE
jgi:hypothetical protein